MKKFADVLDFIDDSQRGRVIIPVVLIILSLLLMFVFPLGVLTVTNGGIDAYGHGYTTDHTTTFTTLYQMGFFSLLPFILFAIIMFLFVFVKNYKIRLVLSCAGIAMTVISFLMYLSFVSDLPSGGNSFSVTGYYYYKGSITSSGKGTYSTSDLGILALISASLMFGFGLMYSFLTLQASKLKLEFRESRRFYTLTLYIFGLVIYLFNNILPVSPYLTIIGLALSILAISNLFKNESGKVKMDKKQRKILVLISSLFSILVVLSIEHVIPISIEVLFSIWFVLYSVYWSIKIARSLNTKSIAKYALSIIVVLCGICYVIFYFAFEIPTNFKYTFIVLLIMLVAYLSFLIIFFIKDKDGNLLNEEQLKLDNQEE